MFPKKINLFSADQTYSITYTSIPVSNHEILFMIDEIKPDVKDSNWDNSFIFHYYPLRKEEKVSMAVYHEENIDKLMAKIAIGILDNERIIL